MCAAPPAMKVTPSPKRLAAARALFDRHWRLGTWVCSKYCRYVWGRRVTSQVYEEMQSLAHEGLWRACLGFDPALGIKFATYASKCIWRRMANHMYTQWVATKRHKRRWLPGLDLPASAADPRAPDPARRLVRADAARLVDLVLANVRGRDRVVIESRAEGVTLDELAAKFGVSKERVRQIAVKVRARLDGFRKDPEVAAQVEERGRPARPRVRHECTGGTEHSWGEENPSQANFLRVWEDGEE